MEAPITATHIPLHPLILCKSVFLGTNLGPMRALALGLFPSTGKLTFDRLNRIPSYAFCPFPAPGRGGSRRRVGTEGSERRPGSESEDSRPPGNRW